MKTKNCPFCNAEIPQEAILCKFCHKILVDDIKNAEKTMVFDKIQDTDNTYESEVDDVESEITDDNYVEVQSEIDDEDDDNSYDDEEYDEDYSDETSPDDESDDYNEDYYEDEDN